MTLTFRFVGFSYFDATSLFNVCVCHGFAHLK